MKTHNETTRFGADPLLPQELATKAYVDAGGSGGDTFARVFKTVDQVIFNSTTITDDDELLIALDANKTYALWGMFVIGTNTVADWKEGWVLPSGASGLRGNSTMSTTNPQQPVSIDSIRANSCSSLSQQYVNAVLRISMGSTSGILNWRWAQNTQTAIDFTVFAGSWFIVWERP